MVAMCTYYFNMKLIIGIGIFEVELACIIGIDIIYPKSAYIASTAIRVCSETL